MNFERLRERVRRMTIRDARRTLRRLGYEEIADIPAMDDEGVVQPDFLQAFMRPVEDLTAAGIAREYRQVIRGLRDDGGLEAQLTVRFQAQDAKGKMRTFWRRAKIGDDGWLNADDENIRITAGTLGLSQYEDEFRGITFTGMSVVTRIREDDEGGASKTQDCLLQCIREKMLLKGYKKGFPHGFLRFRERLGIPKGPIGIEYIPRIEEDLKRWRIVVVRGEKVIYEGKPREHTCTVVLHDCHYSPEYSKNISGRDFTSMMKDLRIPRAPMLLLERNDKTVTVRTKFGVEEMPKIKFKRLQEYDKVAVRYADPLKDPKDELDEWIRQQEEVLTATEGKLNLFSRGTFAEIAEDFWRATCMVKFSPISMQQQIWMKDASMGALTYAKPGFVENATSIDANALYPHLMTLTSRNVPTADGEFTEKVLNVDALDYRSCNIWSGVTLEGLPAPWRVNRTGKYREGELKKLLLIPGVTCEQIGTACKILEFERGKSCETMCRLFHKFVKFLGEWEERAVAHGLTEARRALKGISRSCWGRLAMKKRKQECWKIVNGSTRRCFKKSFEILSVYPIIDSQGKPTKLAVTTKPVDRIYEGVLPGVAYVIMSAARVKMGTVLEDMERRGLTWHRVYVDSVLFEGTVEDLADRPAEHSKYFQEYKFSKQRGHWKVEKQGSAEIVNTAKVIWRAGR